MYQFENICVHKRCLLSACCIILCSYLLECLFLYSVWAVRNFRPDFVAMSNLKRFVCMKDAFCLHFAKLCVLSFWNACFCSSIAFGLLLLLLLLVVLLLLFGYCHCFVWLLFSYLAVVLLFGCCCCCCSVVWLLFFCCCCLMLLFAPHQPKKKSPNPFSSISPALFPFFLLFIYLVLFCFLSFSSFSPFLPFFLFFSFSSFFCFQVKETEEER